MQHRAFVQWLEQEVLFSCFLPARAPRGCHLPLYNHEGKVIKGGGQSQDPTVPEAHMAARPFKAVSHQALFIVLTHLRWVFC